MIQGPSAQTQHITSLLSQRPLFVFALSSEAAEEFNEDNILIAGIGKVNAAFNLTKKIQEERPGLIVNLGSAGSNTFKRGEVVCCNRFIQRDMDVTGLGYRKYETPFSDLEPVLEYGFQLDGFQYGICGTGDNFETGHTTVDYNVIDMEAYSLAMVAMKENIPFLCLKYITDGADGGAAEEWSVQVHHAAAAFRKIISGLQQ
ncbi:nucleosidase [Chitinophaga varians]|uniref:5'-methylthioadenosine/S-adenosylhomocysteine nucleosidase family protein n=1 Tax=Chitinophaga varians TaxID=2202339 RepID=UPI00165F995E|nr:nucleosidase [Chitinophaga varians]MBC9912987.1 nucleosidase [Chitinophaga varians]